MKLQETLITLTIISGLAVATYSILTNFEEKYGKANYELIQQFEEEHNIRLPDYYNEEIINDIEIEYNESGN